MESDPFQVGGKRPHEQGLSKTRMGGLKTTGVLESIGYCCIYHGKKKKKTQRGSEKNPFIEHTERLRSARQGSLVKKEKGTGGSKKKVWAGRQTTTEVGGLYKKRGGGDTSCPEEGSERALRARDPREPAQLGGKRTEETEKSC